MAIGWEKLLLVIGIVGGVIGGVTGVVSLIAWIHRWVSNSLRRPKLRMNFDRGRDVIIWQTYHDGMSKKW